MAADGEKRHLLSQGATGSYLGAVQKNGHNSLQGQVPALALSPQHGGHCHTRGASSQPGQQQRVRRKLYLAAGICLVFMVGEVVEILGALLSVASIWVVTSVLVYLAAQRLISGDYDLDGSVMIITSACAVAANIVMGLALHQTGHGHSHRAGGEEPNASVRAAFVHVVGDLLQSVGVLIASYIIYFKVWVVTGAKEVGCGHRDFSQPWPGTRPEYKYMDPICTFLFSVLVLGTTLTIFRDIVLVLMEGTPKGMDFNAVQEALLAVAGVEAVHSLHIWALTAAQPLLSVHIAINADANAQEVLEEASSRLQGTFHFHTTTIQVESFSEEMRDCHECQPPRD
ncbi:proton-coupled zinc antiporter SLC30A2 isoform X3 [Pogoniulus pusillus]|uniref:proton-coupled zinc antiporter SLC30A2 isoform X3 n=1 Tax=Pogoniulus pusillus TaxID=488313 RepID=UPI0030B9A85B